MGVVAVFDYPTWALTFPQFSNLSSVQVSDFILPIAQGYVRNDGGGPVSNVQQQSVLLNLMVAHVAQLLFGSTTQPLSPLVGRITDATQGSVSVSADMPEEPGAAWFQQTTYGAMFWQLSLPYRTFRYIPRCRPAVNPWPNR